MEKKKLTGECLCGAVKFAVADRFKTFNQCHCKQCQQLTGTAFASNLSTDPDNIEWLSGQSNILSYEHPSRGFSKAFCSTCGSALPFLNKAKTLLFIPAGSLNELPDLAPQANIFKAEQASWLDSGLQAKDYPGFRE